MENVVLAVVNLVEKVLIVDSEHLILQQGSVGLLVLLLDLLVVLLGLLRLGIVLVVGMLGLAR